MKIKSLFTLLCMAAPLITSCQPYGGNDKDKPIITYGNIEERVFEIRPDELYDRMKNSLKRETFLLLTTTSGSCGCNDTSKETMKTYAKKYQTLVYLITLSTLSNDKKAEEFNFYGIDITSKDPALYLVSNGEIKDTLVYNHEKKILTDVDVTHDAIRVRFQDPNQNLVSITYEYLDNELIGKKKTFSIEYIWSSCSDCLAVTPDIIWTHGKDIEYKQSLYIVDIDSKARNNQGAIDPSNYEYITFMENHRMDEKTSPTYGYRTGKVPCFQHYSNGVLDDAAVLLNEQYEDNIVTNWYFTEERVKNLKYLTNITDLPNIIGKQKLKSSTKPFMNEYKVFGDAFLDYYCK